MLINSVGFVMNIFICNWVPKCYILSQIFMTLLLQTHQFPCGPVMGHGLIGDGWCHPSVWFPGISTALMSIWHWFYHRVNNIRRRNITQECWSWLPRAKTQSSSCFQHSQRALWHFSIENRQQSNKKLKKKAPSGSYGSY